MSRWCTLTALCVGSLAHIFSPENVALAQSGPPAYMANGGSGVVPAGYGTYQRQAPAPYYGPMGPLPSGPGRTIYEELPDDQGWLYQDSPLERMLKNSFRHAYFRTEYLLWDVSDPGNNILGAPSNLMVNLDRTRPLALVPVNDVPVIQMTDANGNPIDAVQPRLNNLYVNENNGIRGTFGLPTFNGGTFEASIFALQTSTGRYTPPDLRYVDIDGDGIVDENGFIVPSPTDTDAFDFDGDGVPDLYSENVVDAVVQGVLIDGKVPLDNNFLLINGLDTNRDGAIDTASYLATLKTSVWGTEANYILDAFSPNEEIVVRPFFGVRYLNFRESLRQVGGYTVQTVDPDDNSFIYNDYVRTINASTSNNLYGPQIGARFETRRKWLALGVTPKLMMGVNTYKSGLATSQILGPDDPSQSLFEKGTTFGLAGDVDLYTRIHLGEHLSVQVGYNFMWAGMLTRPADNIVYNVSSTQLGLQSDFRQDIQYSGAILQGLSLGAQLEY